MKVSLENAWRSYLLGKTHTAEALCLALLRLDRDDASALELLGHVLYDMARYPESLDALEHASLIKPVGDQSQFVMACCYAELGYTTSAADLFFNVAYSGELSDVLTLEAATQLHNLGSTARAFEVCHRLVGRSPFHAQAHYNVGYYGSIIHAPSQLVEDELRIALRLKPTSVQYRMGLISLLCSQRRLEEAAELADGIDAAGVEQIDCDCCLRRLAAVYRLPEDPRRSLCLARIATMATRGDSQSYSGTVRSC